jgi:eukaryotic-like serine/threonine-protein kinase
MDLTIGQILGDYDVLGVIGSGGMGKVYKVRNRVSQRIEAIKILLPDLNAQPELTERFLREIRISAALEHPNIAALRTAQELDNRLLMVMEYVDGSTLGALMEKARLPLDQSLAYVSQALSALEYAHGQGVIHRDIKPGNIMVTRTGQVKLMDFGIARLSSDSRLTKTGLTIGSIHYMSPEQIEGHELDVRSDIYSLGVTLYEMVTGKRPFNGSSEYQIMAAHLKGDPQPPIELDHSLPPALNEIILTALARNAANRFASARAMQNAMTTVVQNSAPVAAPSRSQPSSPGPPPPASKSHRALYMTVGSLATLALVVGAAIEIPRLHHAHADGGAQMEQQTPANQVLPNHAPSIPAPAAGAGTPEASTQQEPAATIPQKAEAPIANPPPPVSGRTADGPKMRVDERPRERAAPRGRAASDSAPPTTMAAPLLPSPDAGGPSMPAADTSPAKVDDAEISALTDRMMLMGARVAAVRSSLDGLWNSQAASGLGLRSDIVASEQRLLAQMDGAEGSLKSNDAKSARKRLDGAEAELDKLEAFFGK